MQNSEIEVLGIQRWDHVTRDKGYTEFFVKMRIMTTVVTLCKNSKGKIGPLSRLGWTDLSRAKRAQACKLAGAIISRKESRESKEEAKAKQLTLPVTTSHIIGTS